MEEKNNKKWARLALKSLAALLAVMAVFTVVSRVAAAFTTIQVTVESPAERRIEHRVTAEGTVEKNRELAVLTEPNIMIKTVYVSLGEAVEEGELLAELDMESLNEHIESIEREIQVLRLQNEAAASNSAQARESRQLARKRAEEDYARTQTEQEGKVAAAAAALQQAQADLAALEQRESDKTNQEAPEGGDSESAEAPESNTEAEHAALEAAVAAAKNAYDEALRNQESALLEASRRIEDTKTQEAADVTTVINELTIADREAELEKLKALEEAGGKILSPTEGVITGLALVTGQKTTDTAAVTMADNSSGMRYVARLSREDAAYLSVGDAVTLSAGGRTFENLSVLSMETEEEQKNVVVTVLLEPGLLSIGSNAVLSATKQSESYPLTLPVSALHNENGKYYVLVLEEEETVLGSELIVRRVDVTVEEQNGQYAAVHSELLRGDSQVITDSNAYVSAGDRVRLRES